MPLNFAIGPEIYSPVMAPANLNLPIHIARNDFQQVLVQGRNPNPPTAAYGDVWGYPSTSGGSTQQTRNVNTAAYTLAVCSDSASDNSSSGTGAQTIAVSYLDVNYVPWTAVFALAGLTAVTAPTSITGTYNTTQTLPAAAITNCMRINGMEVLTVGTGLVNAGNVYAYDNTSTLTSGVPQTASKVYNCILVGDNLSTSALFTTPAGYNGMLVQVSANLVTTAATTLQGKNRILFAKQPAGIALPLYFGSITTVGDGVAALDPVCSPVLPPMTDIKGQSVASSATSAETQFWFFLLLWSSTN